MQGMIDMALLPIEESTGKKKYTENHLNSNSGDQLYMQRTNTQTQARDDEKEGGRAGAEEDVRVEPRTTQKCFYSRGGGAAGAPGAALACSVILFSEMLKISKIISSKSKNIVKENLEYSGKYHLLK
jgi:hypothetical protein